MRPLFALVVLALLPACAPEGPEEKIDRDGDGHADGVDCDDADDTVFPGAEEHCDGRDEDCDEAVDEDAVDAATFHADADGDGYGDAATATTACAADAGWVGDATDCDDDDDAVHPDAPEDDCADPVDYNCDGSVGYADADADGWAACEECDDADATRNPDAPEVCDEADVDEDCDALADDADPSVDAAGAAAWYRDADGDGYGDAAAPVTACDAPEGFVADATDCDDADDAVSPGAVEVCDLADVDEDCDAAADDADPSATGATAWHADADGDGHGDATRPTTACDAPEAHVADAADCDDTDAAVFPDAPEDDCADPTDYNCDGSVGYRDADADGWAACEECDDTDAARHPGAVEVCDPANVDEDCDAAADDADPSVDPAGAATWHADADGDGFGDPDASVSACDAPAAHVADATDCDDTRAAVSPAAVEVCDDARTDEDCDGRADDDDDSPAGASRWYRDADGDGHAGTTAITACLAPPDHHAAPTDCDDADASVSPDAAEVCDPADVDEDCDALADDADPSVDPAGAATWHADADRDGYGDPDERVSACDAPAGYVVDGGDCDDAAAGVSPGATEACDDADTDEDCDGRADDADDAPAGTSAWYRDADRDGFGDGAARVDACAAPADHVATASDCDDADAAVSPAAAEVCDDANVDEDCDALADDADPSATGKRTRYVDADGDGFGRTAVTRCDHGAGYVDDASDCDDGAASVYPGAPEVCDDAIDQDCAGGDEVCPEVRYDGIYDPDHDAVAKLHGEGLNDQVGLGLVGGDFDGDGVGDLVVGAWGWAHASSRYDGGVFGYYGPFAAGTQAVTAHDDLNYYDDRGLASGYGRHVSNVGDIDADGRDDLVVSGNSGAWLYLGGDTGESHLYARYDAGAECDDAAPAGNLADGAWLCGYKNADSDRGAVFVYDRSGASLAKIAGYPNFFLGSSVAGGQDVDGDGVDDVWAGAYNANYRGFTGGGAAVLFHGPLTTEVSVFDADVTVTGEGTYWELGTQVEIAGDMDGDGAPDLLASVPGDDTLAADGGAVHLFTEPASGTASAVDSAVVFGAAADDQLSAFTTGDFDGDGVLDVVVASALHDAGGSDAGAAWLVYGPLTGTIQVGVDHDAVWLGDDAGDWFGAAVATIPDVDDDGDDEIAFGAPVGDSLGATDRGAVWIWSGR